MDYHFVVPKTTLNKRRLPIPLFVVPIFILSAVLPFLLTYFFSPSSLNFSSKADNTPELRVWFTPSRVVAHPGQEVTLTVKANYDGGDQLIPSMRIQVDSDSLSIKNNALFYPKPFRGEVTLGTVTVTPTKVGDSVITIPKESVRIDPPIQNVEILVSSASFVVK